MLGTARRLAFTTAQVKAGNWLTPDNFVLNGKTLGVIGAGAIGMKTQAWTFNPTDDRSRELGVALVDLDTLLATSDVVSIHVKLTKESRHLVGARELGLMKPNSLLINTARGPVVDSASLVEALNSGHLAGAGIDVFDQEPLEPNDPLLSCEHVVLTPHTADQNTEGRDLLNSGAVDNILAYLDGKPQNVVT
jgi:D-3-phosphoglycerate dehydrogenase